MLILPIISSIFLTILIIFTILSWHAVLHDGFYDRFYISILFISAILLLLFPLVITWVVYLV